MFFFFLFVFSRDASLAKASREARAQCAASGTLETSSDAIVKDNNLRKIFIFVFGFILLDIFRRDSEKTRDRG